MHNRGVRGHLAIIERVTGHRPPTCPWRAFYHPLVREVMAGAWASERGNINAVLGDDAPWILVQAVGAWERAVSATQSEDREINRRQRQRDAAAAKHRSR